MIQVYFAVSCRTDMGGLKLGPLFASEREAREWGIAHDIQTMHRNGAADRWHRREVDWSRGVRSGTKETIEI